MGCGAPPTAPLARANGVRCPADWANDGHACRRLSGDLTKLDEGARELDAFRPDEALQVLEAARKQGPYRYADHVRLYEKLGVAHAYLDHEREAIEAFDMLLSLSPGHAIRYTLSPKATFAFEKAREEARRRRPPEIRVTWRRDLEVTQPIPMEVEVVADPKHFLRRARLHWRRKGTAPYRSVELALLPAGAYERVLLPPVAPNGKRAEVVEIFLAAYNGSGSEVLLWGEPSAPRDVAVGYRAPNPWYGRWWVWALAVGVVAAITGVAVFAATQEPPDRVEGTFNVR
jgi:hypothetical protein